jgi:3-phosphoshikimate 1-carboxyvinyltransferase
MTTLRRVHTIRGPLDAVVSVPGSKSIANRALVCGALADGISVLTNVPDGDDTVAMLDCLRVLGIDSAIDIGRVAIVGSGGRIDPSGDEVVHAALAGTTSRFVTAMAALGSNPITIDGYPPLRRRPFGPLYDALEQLGVDATPGEVSGNLPVTIKGPPTGQTVTIGGDVSSQFISALMLIGPYLPDGLTINLSTRLISRPYIGHSAITIADDQITVAAGRYVAASLSIEPDASSASYPLALAAVLGGTVHIPGLGLDALQGDSRFADLLAEMGCSVVRSHDGVWVGRDLDQDLEGIDLDMGDISDLVPTAAVVAAFAASPTVIRGVAFIRAKESDRLGDLAAELRQAGVDIDETDDGLTIRPSRHRLREARLGTHHDHRLAMAFGVLGSVIAGIEVENPEVVSKSWPNFWDMLDRIPGTRDD